MPSAAEPSPPLSAPNSMRAWRKVAQWNRKLHFYSGLFLIFFMWLFAFSGLLLNHPTWAFSEFWQNRSETNYTATITAPAANLKTDLGQGRDILRQLGIEGEIMWTTRRTNPALMEFQARRPGHFYFINADWNKGHATVRRAEVNVWGKMKALHAFTGVQLDDPRNRRDWFLTAVWAYSMDAVAAGLIFMVLSSLYMWWELPQKRVGGVFALALGTVSCGLFCFGLRWLF